MWHLLGVSITLSQIFKEGEQQVKRLQKSEHEVCRKDKERRNCQRMIFTHPSTWEKRGQLFVKCVKLPDKWQGWIKCDLRCWLLTFICCCSERCVQVKTSRLSRYPDLFSLSPAQVQSGSYIHCRTQQNVPSPLVVDFLPQISSLDSSSGACDFLPWRNDQKLLVKFPRVLSESPCVFV